MTEILVYTFLAYILFCAGFSFGKNQGGDVTDTGATQLDVEEAAGGQ
jgi:hypothetical protein